WNARASLAIRLQDSTGRTGPMTHARGWQRVGLCAVVALLTGSSVSAQEKKKEKEVDEAFAGQVNAAIDRGIKYLRSLQQPDGMWHYIQGGGGGLGGFPGP